MITSTEAEAQAIKVTQDYLTACGALSGQEKANALMKLCSVAAVLMVDAVGPGETIDRIVGTAKFIEQKTRGIVWIPLTEH